MSLQAFFDFGNSRVKAWLCDGNQVICRFSKAHSLSVSRIEQELPELFRQPVNILGVASVLDEDFNHQFEQLALRVWGQKPVHAYSDAPSDKVSNGYRKPKGLGVDRWMNILAVSEMTQCCVVSCGTALTIDLVAGKKHHGGYILPGYSLQVNALVQGTRRVRPEALEVKSLEPGRDTDEAVHRGIIIGLVSAVEHVVRDFEVSTGQTCAVVLTGGDAEKLGAHMSVSHDIIPELMLLGLQRYFG